jgi:hypothetical protein
MSRNALSSRPTFPPDLASATFRMHSASQQQRRRIITQAHAPFARSYVVPQHQ